MSRLYAALLAMDPNQRNYWLGLLLLFLGLAGYISLSMALLASGAVMIVESTLTSYLAAWISARKS